MTTQNETLHTEEELKQKLDDALSELLEAKKRFVNATCKCGKEGHLKAIDTLEEKHRQLWETYKRGEYRGTK